MIFKTIKIDRACFFIIMILRYPLELAAEQFSNLHPYTFYPAVCYFTSYRNAPSISGDYLHEIYLNYTI